MSPSSIIESRIVNLELVKKCIAVLLTISLLAACGSDDTDNSEDPVDDSDDNPVIVNEQGLWAHKFDGSWTQLPDFTLLSAESSEVVSSVCLLYTSPSPRDS